MIKINKSTLEFLEEIAENNNREWFAEHKDHYLVAQENLIDFVLELRDRMEEHDDIVPKTRGRLIMRIYRDVRFSKDKSPFKRYMGGSMARATQWLRGGYYFHIEPGNSFVAGGFFNPNSADLRRIRDEIAYDDKPLRRIMANKEFVDTFGGFTGNKVKTAPKGFSKDHPAIDLIRYKQFIVKRLFSDKEVLSENFLDKMVQTFLVLRPYFDYMSEVLTSDSNGVSLKG